MPVLKITQESVVSGDTLAFCLGLSPGRITQLASEGRLVQTDGKKYKLVSSLNVYHAELKAKAREKQVNEDDDIDEIKKQKLIQETEKLRKENLIKDGKLVEVDFAIQVQSEIYENIKQQFENLAHKITPLLIGEDRYAVIKDTIQKEIDGTLKDLSTKSIEQWCKELAIPAEIAASLDDLQTSGEIHS